MTEENEVTKHAHIKTAVGVAGMILAPVFSYVLFETVTRNLMTIPMYKTLLNISWFALIYLAVFSVSGSSRFTIGFGSAAFYILSLAETFVVAFRSKPIMLWEFLAVRTAMTVAGTYEFEISKRMIAAGILVIAYNIVLWRFPVKIEGWKTRLALGGSGLAGVAVGVYLFYQVIIPNTWLEVNQWAMKESYEENGFVLASAITVKYFIMDPPAGYSMEYLEEMYDSLTERMDAEAQEESGEEIQPVNIICIMNESLSELKVAGDFETNIPYFPYMDSLTDNTVKGSLYVPVFGSLTSNSEFEFLSGDLVKLMPSNTIAYQMYVKDGAKTLVSTLKDQGYSAIAMHPYPGANWNRDKVYEYMGFDEFYDEDYYKGSDLLRAYVSDRGDYDKIIELVEQKENPDDKLFVFNVTMQNHGGYGGDFENFDEEVWLTGDLEGKYPKTDQYLSLMKKSDEAFQYLTEYFAEKDEPTMIVMFGDHQPSVEYEFYDEIAGKPSSETGAEERSKWYQTPFVIWTNYEMPEQEMEGLGAIYLSSYVLKLANLDMAPYNQFLLELSEMVPVVNFVGCYDTDMNFYLWGDAEDGGHSFSEKLREYKMLVYNHSMDTKKLTEMYTVRSSQ